MTASVLYRRSVDPVEISGLSVGLDARSQGHGSETGKLVQAILLDRPPPEQGYLACLGVIRLGRRYPPERIEAAAKRANRSGVRSYKRLQVHP